MTEIPRLLYFELRGQAELQLLEKQELAQAIYFLNNESDRIAQQIQQEIKRSLPPSVHVEAQLSFFEGSIGWEGVILVLDWMARLGGTAEFIGVLVTIIRIAVNRVLRRWLSDGTMPFKIRGANFIQSEVIVQTEKQSQVRWNAMSTLTIFTAINTLLLVALLILWLVR